MSNAEPIAFSRPYFDDTEAAAAAAVIASGWVVGGPRLHEFEQSSAAVCGAAHAVGVSSWTTGAFLVLHAWGIGPGDEVIVPSLTFIASVNVIRHVGATPVFVDINPRTFNLDPEDVARKVTPRTRAIIAVDQLGMPCEIDQIVAFAQSRNIKVLDDAACAFGSFSRGRPVGALADATVFSLHARKVVTTGEGGLIMVEDGDFAARLRRLRHQGMSLSDHQRHGMPPTAFESYPEIGFNFRITDIQAAIGIAQLDKLDLMLSRRCHAASFYQKLLVDHPLFEAPHEPSDQKTNWQSYQVRIRDCMAARRNEVMERLHAAGIPTRRGVMASHLEAPYLDINAELPATVEAASATLQLPMHPALSEEQLARIAEAVRSVTRELDVRWTYSSN